MELGEWAMSFVSPAQQYNFCSLALKPFPVFLFSLPGRDVRSAGEGVEKIEGVCKEVDGFGGVNEFCERGEELVVGQL